MESLFPFPSTDLICCVGRGDCIFVGRLWMHPYTWQLEHPQCVCLCQHNFDLLQGCRQRG